jgi:hypothetical protein
MCILNAFFFFKVTFAEPDKAASETFHENINNSGAVKQVCKEDKILQRLRCT